MRLKLWPYIIPFVCCLATFPLAGRQSDAAGRWSKQYDSASRALEQGRYSEAASLFIDAVQLAEKFGINDVRLAESLNGLAQVYRYQQNYAASEPLARRSLAIIERANGPSDKSLVPSLVNLAGATRALARYAEAEQLYRRLLSIRWGSPETATVSAGDVLEKLAEVLNYAYERDSAFQNALEKYWRSISESRPDKDLYGRMRDLLLSASLLPEAESLMQRAVRLHPDSRQLQYQFAEVYMRLGKYEKAIEKLEEALRLSVPSDDGSERRQRSVMYSNIAQMNFFLVRFDDAFAALTTALELNPGSTSSRVLLGALYLRRNKFEEAASEYQRVISASPMAADAHDGLAQVDLARGRYSEAVHEADKALAIDPGLQSSRYTKAMALIRDGNDREARKVLEEFEQREADRRVAESPLAEIQEIDLRSSALLAQGRHDDAIESLRQGIRSHPLSIVLRRKLGLIQSRLGRHREAVETFEAIILLKPEDFLVHRQLALEYEALGTPDGAQQQRVIYLQKYDAALQAKTN
jgi:tetratricopeptide (TPR) repeat protein